MSSQSEQQHASQVIAVVYQNSFFNQYWNAIGRFLGRGKPTSIWLSAAVVMGTNLLLGVTIATLLKETEFTTSDAIKANVLWITYSFFYDPPSN